MEQQLPTNCPICDSVLKTKSYFKEDIYYNNANCENCNRHYHMGIDYSKSGQDISVRFKNETFFCGPYIIKNRYIVNYDELLYCEIWNCKIGDNKLKDAKLNFILDPKTLTEEKLKSYLMLM